MRPIPATDQVQPGGSSRTQIDQVLDRRLEPARDAEHEVDVLRAAGARLRRASRLALAM